MFNKAHALPRTILLTSTILASPALADETSSPNLGFIEEIVVSGTRIVSTNQPTATSILSQADLERRDVYRVTDGLTLLPGVSFQPGNRGGERNEASVYVRGFDLSRVPVLLDGIPIYVPYDGYVDLNRLQTFSLDGIEVARGYASVLYGPNAMAGAINLVSRRPVEGVSGQASARVDFSNHLDARGYRISGLSSYAASDWYAQAAVGWLDQDYTTLPDSFVPGTFQPRGKRVQSATEDLNINGKFAYTPEGDEYVVTLAHQDGEKGAPPYAENVASRAIFFGWPSYDKTSAYLNTKTGFGHGWSLRGRFFYDSLQNQIRYDNATYTTQRLPFAFTSNYDDDTYGGSTELTAPLSDTTDLKIAGFLKQDTHREFNPNGGPVSKMSDLTGSVAASIRSAISNDLTLSSGISYDFRDARYADNPSVTGTRFAVKDQDAFNAQAGLEYAVNQSVEVYSGISRKARFATMFERYSYRLGAGQPNPALKPETLTTVEAGVRGDFAPWLKGSAGIFFGEARNYVQSVTIGTSPTPPFSVITQSQNVGKVEVSGLEADLSATYEWASARLAYTYLDRTLKNRPGVLTFGTPKNKIDLDVEADLGQGFFAQGNLAYRDGQLTTDTGTGNPIDDYTVAGLKAGWRNSSGLTLEAAVINLFDKLYEFDDGYPGEGRSFSLTLRQKF